MDPEVEEIPDISGDLYYSPAILQIESIETELKIMKNILEEFQDSETEYSEFP